MKSKTFSLTGRRRIKQHEDLRRDPQYRHLAHRNKAERLTRQLELEGDTEIKEYIERNNKDE